tara:strand:+ start:38374 stop:38559 length:186 start_codon:yes stop_codon:yes gene_type:complete
MVNPRQRNGLELMFRAFKQKRVFIKKVIFIMEDRYRLIYHILINVRQIVYFSLTPASNLMP